MHFKYKGLRRRLELTEYAHWQWQTDLCLIRASCLADKTVEPQASGRLVRNLTFYTTPGCHLCEIAAQLIVQLRSVREISLVEIDIATDERLVARYGTRIPVVSRDDTLQELGWPFTLDELERFAAR